MNKRVLQVLIFLSSLCCLQNLYAQCATDPGDKEVSMFSSSSLLYANSGNQPIQVASGKVLFLNQSGTYSFHLNGGSVVADGPGEYFFTTECTFNNAWLYVNEGAKVTILGGLQNGLSFVNRGELTILTPSNKEPVVNFNSDAYVINAGTINIVGAGLRIDGAYSNLSLVNVDRDMWLNSNKLVCLANHSIMNVGGSSHLNSPIRGDGGCLHSVGTISKVSNFVANNGLITPYGDLTYICTETGFSGEFHYVEGASENKSGGAVLQNHCQGCSGGGGGGGGGGDVGGGDDDFTYGILIYGDTIICQNSSTSLGVNVQGKPGAQYTYRWVKVVDEKEIEVAAESGASRLTVYPTEMTKYRVYVTENGTKLIGSRDIVVKVLTASAFLSKENDAVIVSASKADSYLWNTGAKTPYISVPLSENERTYSVDLTIGGKTCTANVVVNNLNDKYDNHKPLQVLIDGPASVCPGSDIVLRSIVSGGSGHYSYEWNTGAVTDSIVDGATISSDYCVKVTDLDLGLVKYACSHVSVPSMQVISNEMGVITYMLDGVVKTINKVPADSTVHVWVENGQMCKLKLYGGVGDTTPIIDTVIVPPYIPFVVVTKDGDTLSSTNDTIYICKGDVVTLSAADDSQDHTYQWLGLNSTSKSVEVSPNSTTTYVLTVSNSDGSFHKVAKKTIVVRRIYSVILSTETQTKAILQGAGGSKYVWKYENVSDPTSDKTYMGNPFVVDYPAGFDTCLLIVDDVCFDTIFFSNKTDKVEIVDGSGSKDNKSYVCLNAEADSVDLSASVSVEGGSLSYAWYKNDLLISTNASIRVKDEVTTEYKVVVTDLNSGKKMTATKTVIVMSAKINKQNDLTAQLVATGGGDYAWSNGGNTQSIEVPANVAGSYTVNVTRDGHQCSAVVNVQPGVVTVPDTIAVVIIPDDGPGSSSSRTNTSLCEGESITLKAGEINGSGRYAYSWNIADETQNHTSQITVSPVESKTYVVHVRDLATGATGTDSFRVNVLSVDVDSVGVGNSVVLFARGGVSYEWSTQETTPSITVPKTSDLTQYEVKITDEFGKVCKRGIDVQKPSIPAGSIPSVTITGTPIVCMGDTVLLSASLSTGCNACSFQWVNNRSYSSPNIVVVPKHSETYTVNVFDPTTGREYTASYRVEVMKAKLTSMIDGGAVTLSASGGTSYLWSNGATTSSINFLLPANVDTAFSVVITNGAVSCEKTITVPDLYKQDNLNIRVDGETEICPNTSTTLTVMIGNDDSYYDDFEVRWKGFPNAGRSITVTPAMSQEYKAFVYHVPTGKLYSTLLAKVAVLESCQGGGGDTIPVDPFVPECGDLDLSDTAYMMTNGQPAILVPLPAPDSVNVFLSGNYQATIPEPGKTYEIYLSENTSLYIHSNVPTSLKMETYDGTLILDGSGPFTFERRKTAGKFFSMSKTSRLIVNTGTVVTIVSNEKNDNTGEPAKMNQQSRLYNRGIITTIGRFKMLNYSRLVNMGSFLSSSSLQIADPDCKITNYNLIDYDRVTSIDHATNQMFSLEAGSVTKFRKISNVKPQSNDASIVPFCGSGCIRVTGEVSGVNVNKIVGPSVNVCLQGASGSSVNKWNWNNGNLSTNCSGCGMSVTPVSKVICDTVMNTNVARLEAYVKGGNGSYVYNWLDPSSQLDTMYVGGMLYPITTSVTIPTPLTSDYTVTRRLVVRDLNNASMVDTVSVSYSVRLCGSGAIPTDTIAFEVEGADHLCLGNKARLKVRLDNAPSGIISYRWSTNEKTDRIVVSPTETTTYWVDVMCARGNDTIVSRKEFNIVVSDCGGAGNCASDLWVNVDQYPDCGGNGAVSVSSTDNEASPLNSFSVRWFDAELNHLSTGYSLSNVPAGDYYVEFTKEGCSAQRKISLRSVDNRELSGLLMTTYDSISPKTVQPACFTGRKIASSQVSSLSEDLSLINANYVVWTGFITPPCDGKYVFQTNTTHGNLFIDNVMRISNNGTLSDSIYLNAGKSYMFAYVKKRDSQEGTVEVKWTTPCAGGNVESIPSCALTADPLVGLTVLMKKESDIPALVSLLEDCDSVACPEPAVKVEPLRQICKAGSSVTLSAYVPGASYQWRVVGNNSVISNQSSISVNHADFYTVEITSWCGSKVKKDFSVQALSTKDVIATASTDAACHGSSVRLNATGGSSYSWTPSEGLSDASSASPTLVADRSMTYTVKVITAGGCVVTKSVDVNVKDPFDFDVVQEFEECNGSKVQMRADGADEYYWYPSDGLSCVRCSVTDVVLGSDEKTYTVEGMKDGCVLKKNVSVRPLLKQSDLDFTFGSSNQCGVVLTASDMGPRVSYRWSVEANPDLNVEGQSVTLYFPSDGDYKVTLTVKRDDCDDSSVVSLTKTVTVSGCNPCNPCVVEH